jgi:hypothetical protein
MIDSKERLLVTHMGHNGPWLLIKTRKEFEDRHAEIRARKPAAEQPLRLKLLKIVNDPLPPELQKAYAAWHKAYTAWPKAHATWYKAYTARHRAYAARLKAYAAWMKADAAWLKADAAWLKAIVTPTGAKFHEKVCGCAWTPEQPDILRQLA